MRGKLYKITSEQTYKIKKSQAPNTIRQAELDFLKAAGSSFTAGGKRRKKSKRRKSKKRRSKKRKSKRRS